MSKNLHEPSTPRQVAANRFSGKLTQQKPYAYEWVTPVNDADCAAAQADPVTYWTPCYLNDWEQPTTLEPLSVRLSADGNLQWKGYVNSQNKTADIAFIMPGTFSFEPDMIPSDSPGNLSYNVFVTPDDGTTIIQGRAYLDSTTGEVTITTFSDSAFFRAYLMQYSGSPGADITGIGTTNKTVFYDWWQNSDTAIFEPRGSGDSANPVMSTDLVEYVRLKAAGAYSITLGMKLADTVNDWKLEWNDSDAPFGYEEGNYGGGTLSYNAVGWLVWSMSLIYPFPDYGNDPPDTYWPDFGSGNFALGYVTAGSRNVSGLSDNVLQLAFLNIVYTQFTIPP